MVKQPYVRLIALQALRLIGSGESIATVGPLVYEKDQFTQFQAVAFLTEVLKKGDPECTTLPGYEKSAGRCLNDWRTWWTTVGRLKYKN